jgi:hypothetical protein
MKRPLFLALITIFLLNALPCVQASADSGNTLKTPVLFADLGYGDSSKEILNKLIPFMVRQAHHERNQHFTVRPKLVEGLVQSLLNLSPVNKIAMKKGEKYDESKDPAIRKGTENWEQSQGGFWVIPVTVVALIFAVLFFNRD